MTQLENAPAGLTVSSIFPICCSFKNTWASLRVLPIFLFPVDELCGDSWVRYKAACYRFRAEEKGVTWYRAEELCESDGSHLVSIMDESEMLMLHSLLVGPWMTSLSRTYIGKWPLMISRYNVILIEISAVLWGRINHKWNEQVYFPFSGLRDKNARGSVYSWSDSRPMIYTSWYIAFLYMSCYRCFLFSTQYLLYYITRMIKHWISEINFVTVCQIMH